MTLTSIEICAGAGGTALGLSRAGFEHAALVEIDPHACATLSLNRPGWHIVPGDVQAFSARPWRGAVDLLSGGVPCPPFSVAGKQLGADDARDLFPEALRLADECHPRAVMLENVRGLLAPKFTVYRADLESSLRAMGFVPFWKLLYAADHGVPQLRPRTILVALKSEHAAAFSWPEAVRTTVSVGDCLYDLMAADGWEGALAWRARARGIGPTIVGGSRKHGGPDLGPTRARAEWLRFGVNGKSLGNAPPPPGFVGDPRLTVRMVARLQGFDDTWQLSGRKTAQYRQVGNAFPPPVAEAVGRQIAKALRVETCSD